MPEPTELEPEPDAEGGAVELATVDIGAPTPLRVQRNGSSEPPVALPVDVVTSGAPAAVRTQLIAEAARVLSADVPDAAAAKLYFDNGTEMNEGHFAQLGEGDVVVFAFDGADFEMTAAFATRISAPTGMLDALLLQLNTRRSTTRIVFFTVVLPLFFLMGILTGRQTGRGDHALAAEVNAEAPPVVEVAAAPAASPHSPPSAPPPSAWWSRHENTNCYNGHGCEDLEYSGVNVDACKAKCRVAVGCEAIVVKRGSDECYLKKNFATVADAQQDSVFDMYVLHDGAEDEPPA